ncbi:hypothetical protein HDU87_006593 [Geranomyces variabilis]|uniref:SWIRM-domain-containing protein n=1 Tax=Geranomyces variabilis TaxID=109894 RepID=A0AAD5TG92_9FUNG|nr:hypothetical protein HDU87_006593 [Geranomyces variabilis]
MMATDDNNDGSEAPTPMQLSTANSEADMPIGPEDAGVDEAPGSGAAAPKSERHLLGVEAGDAAPDALPPAPGADAADSSEAVMQDAGGLDGSGMNVRVADIDSGPSSASKMLVPQSQEIIIPSYSAWFNMSRINDTERKALPEFFNNKNKSKTPSVYKDYRDFMINTYRLNPSEYLTVTACRRNLAGDVCAIVRVHAFLEQWGLINYQVDPDSRPSSIGPAFTGHFRVTADTPRGLQPIYPAVPLLKAETRQAEIAPTVQRETAPGEGGGAPVSSLQFSKNIYSDAITSLSPRKHGLDGTDAENADGTAPPAKKIKHSCATCAVDCPKVRYHSSKSPAMEICANCYIEGRFPSQMYSGDFVKMEEKVAKHAAEEEWSEQETLLLLEGIELFDEDWSKVSDHVGTRTRDQCILKFLQLPIEDPYIGIKGTELGPLQYQRIPFSAADNPVLSLTAFLASVVDPKVASAAAKAAVQELRGAVKKEPVVQDASGTPKASAPPAEAADAAAGEAAAGEAASAAMDVDETAESSGQKVEESAVMDVDTETATQPVGEAGTAKQPTSTSDEPSTTNNTPAQSGRADSTLQTAAATAIASASVKAHALASHATSELHALTLALIQAQWRKVEAKMSHFEDMEALLERERKDFEREKQRLYAERLAFRKMVAEWEAGKENLDMATGMRRASIKPGSTLDSVLGGPMARRVGSEQFAQGAPAPDAYLVPLE